MADHETSKESSSCIGNEISAISNCGVGGRLKRSFTLPRNPFSSNHSKSKRKMKSKLENGEIESDGHSQGQGYGHSTWKKIISRVAKHIGAVPSVKNYHFHVGQADANRLSFFNSHVWGAGQVPGVTALKNHGNTCFINAVLQCIAHTDPLSEYFVLDHYRTDLSRRNKLNSKKFGTRGEITEQLALLLKSLWSCQYKPEQSAHFKSLVEKYGPQYRGNQQHDAHEFLQWLLDKVHEDLNTASKKKYKSIKAFGRSDEIVAAETLANHIRCNNSFVQAVFQAQFRSSLSCSRCRTQSNTFDPFHCISVQLPQLCRQSIYVTVVYTSQQPRQVKLGISLPCESSISELRDVLVSDTSISRSNILLTEIDDSGFVRTFNDSQLISIISDTDSIYCIEMAQLKDAAEESDTSGYLLLCWVNILISPNGLMKLFGSPYTMQISRETSYNDIQKLLLKEMAPILYDDVLSDYQKSGVFKIRILDSIFNGNEPPCYLDPSLQHPLFMEFVEQALTLGNENDGPSHLKMILEWTEEVKELLLADDSDVIEEHASVKQLQMQSLQGGYPLTLEECLKHYTKSETLAVEDAWRCPQCQQYLPVIKTLDIWSLPDILVVHFKRFRQQQIKGRCSTKLTTMVEFPVTNFDMTAHLANQINNNTNVTKNINGTSEFNANNVLLGTVGWSPWKRSRKVSHPCSNVDNTYDLYAVCYHHGTDLETGHYTAACKNSYDNQWYSFDDTKSRNLSQNAADLNNELVNNEAYILFYQKRTGNFTTYSNNSINSTDVTNNINESHWISRVSKFYYPLNSIPNSNANVKTIEEENTSQITIDVNSKAENGNNNTKRVYTTSIYVNGSEGDSNENADKVNELNENRLSYYENQNRGYSTLDTAVMERNKVRLGEAEKIYHSDDEAPTARIHWVSSV